MRIINRIEFLKLPENTLYMSYEPQIYGDLEIKLESLQNDFYVEYLHGFIEGTNCSGTNSEAHDYAEKTGETFIFSETSGRDGCFDDDQLFAVYDNEDIIQLINKLAKCLK